MLLLYDSGMFLLFLFFKNVVPLVLFPRKLTYCTAVGRCLVFFFFKPGIQQYVNITKFYNSKFIFKVNVLKLGHSLACMSSLVRSCYLFWSSFSISGFIRWAWGLPDWEFLQNYREREVGWTSGGRLIQLPAQSKINIEVEVSFSGTCPSEFHTSTFYKW